MKVKLNQNVADSSNNHQLNRVILANLRDMFPETNWEFKTDSHSPKFIKSPELSSFSNWEVEDIVYGHGDFVKYVELVEIKR